MRLVSTYFAPTGRVIVRRGDRGGFVGVDAAESHGRAYWVQRDLLSTRRGHGLIGHARPRPRGGQLQVMAVRTDDDRRGTPPIP